MLSNLEFFDCINAALEPGQGVISPQALRELVANQACYVVGRNTEAQALLSHFAGEFNFQGLVDDQAVRGEIWNGLPVCHMSDLPPQACVFNCSTSIAPVSVGRKLNAQGVHTVFDYCALIHASGRVREGQTSQLPWPWFVREQRLDYLQQAPLWYSLYSNLQDEESRQVLLDVLRYRLSGDPHYTQAYSVRLLDQYIEPFMHYHQEVYVDGGAYDGDTAEVFCRLYPDYRKVILFEPSAVNLEAARRRLQQFERIDYRAVGLSDSAGFLGFDAGSGSASRVNPAHPDTIEVRTLDAEVPEAVSCIKMDLEGWETQALKGCVRQIRDHHPKLALSVYHQSSDFWRIPLFVQSIRTDYTLYLRHYTEGWSETVMYFVPTAAHSLRIQA